jgi:hypothetical protein
MASTTALWGQRDHVLQTLYIPPMLQSIAPDLLFGVAPGDDLIDAIRRYEFPWLTKSLEFFNRGAATRFFNLPSAKQAIETALRSEWEAVNSWLTSETSMRFAFDFFGAESDPLVGFGIIRPDISVLRFTRTVRLVLQRSGQTSYVVWTAYPLLSPRCSSWIESYDYKAHPPKTKLNPVFYDFLNAYLSVTSDCLMVNSVTQGVVDFWRYEDPSRVQGLHVTLKQLNPQSLDVADVQHFRYELMMRCLDETVPPHHVEKPSAFVASLQHGLAGVVDQPVPDYDA